MDMNAAQIKAKSKLQFWTLLLCGIIIIGGGFEYFLRTQPLDEIVVYVPQKSIEKAATAEVVAPAPEKAEKVNEQPKAEPVKEVEPEKSEPVVQANPHAAKELLDYMDDMKQKVNAVTYTETALDKIKQTQPQAQPVAEKAVFEENKIEIYDDKKGVVGVIETTSEVVAPVESHAENAPATPEPQAPAVSEEQAIAQQILENKQAQAEIDEVIKQEQAAAEKATQAVQKLIDSEIAVEDGEEKPIVLIPGLQQPQE